jgi:hypothetical protein
MNMKKIVATAAALAALAFSAAAQDSGGIKVSGWARSAFVPWGVAQKLNDQGEITEEFHTAGIGDTGRDFAYAEVYIAGSNDWAGFHLNLSNSYPDNQDPETKAWYAFLYNTGYSVWLKPLGNDWLKLQLGNFSEETLKGKVGGGNGGFSNFTYRGYGGEDDIFTSFSAKNGIVISSAPDLVPGLFAAMKLNMEGSKFWGESSSHYDGLFYGDEVERFWSSMQIGVGYEIAGIGLARLQFIGSWKKPGVDGEEDRFDLPSIALGKPVPRLEAAFAFTMIENLVVDLGYKFWLPWEQDTVFVGMPSVPTTYWRSQSLSLGADFSWTSLRVNGRVDIQFGDAYVNEYVTTGSGLELNWHLVPAWDFGFIKAGLDLGMSVNGPPTAVYNEQDVTTEIKEHIETRKTQTGFGIGAFAERKIGPGTVKAGIAWNLGKSQEGKQLATSAQAFTIPIILEVAF